MAAPTTKEEALRKMRLMWFAFLMAVVVYLYIGATVRTMTVSPPWVDYPKTLIGLAVLDLFLFLLVLFQRYFPSLQNLRSQLDDPRAVRLWQVHWTVLATLALCQTLYGLMFWMGNKTFMQSLPFFILGSIMLLSLWPRQVWSPANVAQ